MASLFPVDLTEQIRCVQREIAMRQNVYPRRVSSGHMSQKLADLEIARMQAVLETLKGLEPSYGKGLVE